MACDSLVVVNPVPHCVRSIHPLTKSIQFSIDKWTHYPLPASAHNLHQYNASIHKGQIRRNRFVLRVTALAKLDLSGEIRANAFEFRQGEENLTAVLNHGECGVDVGCDAAIKSGHSRRHPHVRSRLNQKCRETLAT